MSLFPKIISAICAFLFAITGLSMSVINFTDGELVPPVDQNYSFNKDRLLIGGYYGGEGYGQLAADAGIDFIIESGVTKAELDEYYEAGVGLIVGGYNLNSLYGNAGDDQITSWVNLDTATYKEHPAIWGDDLIDEPTALCYGTLAKAVKSYRSKFPDKFCLINLFPIYANEEQLGEKPEITLSQKVLCAFSQESRENVDKYKRYVSDYINTIDTDYICVDIYPYYSDWENGREVKRTGEWYLANLDILAEACRETGRDLWVITQAAGETETGESKSGAPRYCDEKSDISQQAYACLAFGTKAIIHAEFGPKGWWDPATSHLIGGDGQPTETYYAAQSVNLDLKAFADIYGTYTYKSTYMLNKLRCAGRMGIGDLATTAEGEKAPVTSRNGLVIGTFDGDNGGKAYVIANMEELNNSVTAKATFNVPDGKTAVIWQGGKAATVTEKTEITLLPGEGVFVEVK